jgi:hypothetical protein
VVLISSDIINAKVKGSTPLLIIIFAYLSVREGRYVVWWYRVTVRASFCVDEVAGRGKTLKPGEDEKDDNNNNGMPAFHIVKYFVSIITDERLGRFVVVVMVGWVVALQEHPY